MLNYTMKKILLFLLLITSILFSSFTIDEISWSLGKNESNINIFTRTYQGSAYKEFKGVMTVQTTLSSLLALMRDVNSYPKWFYECPEAYAIKVIANKEGYNYLTYKLPWPLNSRDMVVHYWVSQDMKDKSVTIKTLGEGNYIPAKEDWIRIQELNGQWKFTPKGNGMVEVIYQVHLEPNGSIPAWLANSTVVDSPYNTLLKMKDMLKLQKYASAKIAEIVE
jgi:ribosome-associated toxin RatA of RatAB toxin-antitoxin module